MPWFRPQEVQERGFAWTISARAASYRASEAVFQEDPRARADWSEVVSPEGPRDPVPCWRTRAPYLPYDGGLRFSRAFPPGALKWEYLPRAQTPVCLHIPQ